jgi:hypothetical protein
MRLLFLFFLMMIAHAAAFSQDDYVIRINDTTFSATPNQAYQVTIDGKKINVSVQVKDTLTYQDDYYSFKYPKELKVSKVTAAPNVDQVMALDASGAGVLIQAYRTMSPVTLTEMIIEQATKENTTYGYSLERTEYERTIKSGHTLKIIKLVQKYKENTRTYEVATYGKKDAGVAIVTFSNPISTSGSSKDVVALMWQSLIIK